MCTVVDVPCSWAHLTLACCLSPSTRTRDSEFDLEFDFGRCLDGLTVSSLPDGEDVQRVTELFDNPHFFPVGGAANSNAIKQGEMGDCWFLAALTTVSCIPELIEKICVAVSPLVLSNTR